MTHSLAMDGSATVSACRPNVQTAPISTVQRLNTLASREGVAHHVAQSVPAQFLSSQFALCIDEHTDRIAFNAEHRRHLRLAPLTQVHLGPDHPFVSGK